MEDGLEEMFFKIPESYNFDNINKRKVIFWTVFAMATTVAYEVALSKGIEYVVNSYKNKKLETSIKKTIKQPVNALSFYQAINNEKVKE